MYFSIVEGVRLLFVEYLSKRCVIIKIDLSFYWKSPIVNALNFMVLYRSATLPAVISGLLRLPIRGDHSVYG